MSLFRYVQVNTEPEREGIGSCSTGTAVEMHPENMDVDALMDQLRR